jgi:hypothetical protein
MIAPAGRAIRYVLVFLVLYYVVMTIFGLVHASGMNILGLIVAVTSTALLFIRKYRRLFSRGEYLTVVIGSILIDVALELGFVAMRNGHISIDRWPSVLLVFGGHALLIALAYSPWSRVVRGYARRVASP